MIREVKFESQDRRIKGIIEALNANGIKAFIQQRRDLRAPFFSQFRQSVLYGSVKFQNVQCVCDLFCKVQHQLPPLFRLFFYFFRFRQAIYIRWRIP